MVKNTTYLPFPIVVAIVIIFGSSPVWADKCGGVKKNGSNPYGCCHCPNGSSSCNDVECNFQYDYDWDYGGNCTWYAWQRRYNEGDPLSNRSWGNARNWASEAEADGFDVENTPEEGAIAVDTNGSLSSYGHVAYVISYNSTTVTVDEQGCCYWNGVRRHTYSRSHFEKYIYENGGGSGDPDLNVERVEISQAGKNDWKHSITIEAGQSFKYDIEAKVENKGEADTDDTIEVEYYISEDKDFDKDKDSRLGKDEIDKIKSGEDETEHLRNLTAPTNPGTYYIFIYIDYDKDEEHKSNNYSDSGDTEEYGVLTVTAAPILSVTPTNYDVSASAGSQSFAVNNTGGGTLNWTAQVTGGGSWLRITSGSSGSNSGTINCSFDKNTTTSERTGTIRVDGGGVTGSPIDLTIKQEAGLDIVAVITIINNIILADDFSPPDAITNAATSQTSNSATLNGTVDSKGLSTEVVFQYGLNTNYGNNITASQNPLTAKGGQSVSANLTGLSANTPYHYRVKATNTAGTTYGGDEEFKTNPITDPCPECLGTNPTVKDETFYAGTECECIGTNSLTIGPNVTIQAGATATFKSPNISVEQPVTIQEGSRVKMGR